MPPKAVKRSVKADPVGFLEYPDFGKLEKNLPVTLPNQGPISASISEPTLFFHVIWGTSIFSLLKSEKIT